jgi:hypothetical protein
MVNQVVRKLDDAIAPDEWSEYDKIKKVVIAIAIYVFN